MPGAYEKVPTGEHYELLQRSVQRCRRAVESGDFVAAGVEFASTLVLQSDRSRKRIEEFVFAGGLDLEFLILNKAPAPLVTTCLQNFSELFTQIHDPFDDDIPPLPLLTFFLCQRHSHYVDIHWSPGELTLMARFLEAHFQLLACRDMPAAVKVAAIATMTTALQTFPVHRISPSAAAVFTRDNCKILLAAVENVLLPASYLDAAQLLLAAVTFGAGTVVVADLPLSLLLMNCGSALLPGIRCSCGRCEFFRRLRKTAAEQDEFGVAAATDAKRSIVINFLRGGLLDVLARVVTLATDDASEEGRKVAVVDSPAAAATPSEAEAPARPDEGAVHVVPSGELCLKTGGTCPRDLARHVTYLVVLYAHLSWRRMSEAPLLMRPEGMLVWRAMATALDREEQLVCQGVVAPHVRTALEVMACLVAGLQDTLHNRRQEEAQKQAQRVLHGDVKPLASRLLNGMMKSFLAVVTSSEVWQPQFARIGGPFLALLFMIYVDQSSTPRSFRGEAGLTCEVEDLPAAVAVCTAISDGWQRRGVAEDGRMAALILTASAAMLVGGVALGRCKLEARRRFLPPPNPVTGPLLESARFVWKHFDLEVSANSETGKCLVIKSLANLIVSRAEMATALVPADDTAKPVITFANALQGRRIQRNITAGTTGKPAAFASEQMAVR